MEIFVPLAYYIGAYRIKSELEDLSLRYLKPDMYKKIEERKLKIEEDSNSCLQEMLLKIQAMLNDKNILNEIKVRTKNIYGIYKRLSEGQKLADIHDLLALKIMVDEVANCYFALGMIHEEYHPINNKFKDYLLEKYHANDEKIFLSRFQKKFQRNLLKAKREILEDIKHYKIPEYYKIQHFYFTLEHEDRKAIRDIIIYDNLNEKLMASNLIGISGFLFRRKILEYLNNSGILRNNGYIYEFNNDIIIEALNVLKKERKNSMDKNVRPYKQKGDTCAIVCMMMVLEYYKVISKANWYDERRLYRIYRSKYMSGTPFSALAFYMAKSGLETTICHESQDLFKNDQKTIDNDIFKFAMTEYKEYLKYAENKGAKIINGVNITIDVLKQKLQEGNLVILAGEVPGGYHAILLTGYDQDGFKVCDPLYKTKQNRTFDEIEKFMNTSIGKWFISVNNKTKEKENLINNLDKFNEEAQTSHARRKIREFKKGI